MGRSSRALVWAAGIWLAALSTVVSAQDARTLFGLGQDAYARGDYEAAIESWNQAYALDPRPALQFNLAQAYGRLGRPEEERDALERFLESSSAAGIDPQDPQIVNAQARLQTLTARLRRTGITLSGVPEGATVEIDEQPASPEAARGAPVPLESGPHRVVVRRQGFQDFTAAVVVRAGESLVVPVLLSPSVVAGPATTSPTRHGSARRTSAIVTTAVGGAALVVGGSLGIAALQKSDGAIDGTSRADSARSLALAADITLGVGLAALTTGIVLFLVGDDSDEPRAATLAPVVGPGSAGLAFHGRF